MEKDRHLAAKRAERYNGGMDISRNTQTPAPPAPDRIQVRGAQVHNLKDLDVDIPLNRLVGIAGVSGSGKSSLALGVLYAEGSRRYLEALSTYTRRRLTQAGRADVDEVLHVPAALALHQRPAVPGVRSTFGTSTELLNSLRLLFSRVGSHVCPNGHRVAPTLNVAAERPITCPVCGVEFFGPSAEELAFNGDGACPECDGTGVVRTVDRDALVPDESLTIDEGAVAPWGTLMWDLMKQVAREMGVRTDVPFNQLTPKERDIVFNGPAEKKHILYKAKKTDSFAELDFTYYNAVYTVENALAKVKDEKGLARVARFLKQGTCPVCHGTRLSADALKPQVAGINLAEATEKTLDSLTGWVDDVPGGLPTEMRPMARNICESFQHTARRLVDLGLGYLSLDRAGSTLSTGERQRVQLARAVRNRTTGVLYVLDEPSIGLHPVNVDGLVEVMRDLLADGNSVVMVDHDARILGETDHIVEIGPGAGAAGGRVIAQGSVPEIEADPDSLIGPFLSGARTVHVRARADAAHVFDLGRIHLETDALHTVKPLAVDVPRGRLTAVTGVSGSGRPRASSGRTSSTPPPSASTCARPWPPTRACTTSCAAPSPAPPRRRPSASRRATSRTTRGSFAARCATARAPSAWTCSSCPTWTSPAPPAAARAMPRRPTASADRTRTTRSISCRCPTSWPWTRARLWLPHPTSRRWPRSCRPSAT